MQQSMNLGDWHSFYRSLRSLGVSVEGVNYSGAAPFSLDTLRTHNLTVSSQALKVEDGFIRQQVKQRPIRHELGLTPSRAEFNQALVAVRESSPGKDGVTINMLRLAGDRVQEQLYRIVCMMFHRPAHEWDKQLRDGLGISLYKGEGSREDLDCYRTIILLPILSRVLGRILSVRIMSFAEEEQLLSGCQWGNRKHRSVQDALFVVRMVTEMAAEVSHVPGACLAVESALVLVFFDIRKHFPSVDRTAAFELFARLGFPQPLIQALDALHSGTSYQACTSEGLSQPYKLTAGFREGCSTSPGLYTIFHDFVMQDFAKRLDALRKECPGHFVELHSLWGRRFNRRVNRSNRPRSRMLQNSTEQLQVWKLLSIMFADDTSLLLRESGREEAERLLASTLRDWGEVIKPSKTKRVLIHPSGADERKGFHRNARLLGGILSYDGLYAQDDAHRLQCAKRIWRNLYQQMPRYGLSPRMQGRRVEAAVIRALVFGTESRVVSSATLHQWQTFLHTIARGLCGQRLSEMQNANLTQQDLLRKLGLRNIHTYVALGQLRFLGHLARLPNDRMERHLLFAWSPRESLHPSCKRTPNTRQALWSRLDDLRKFLQLPVEGWHQQWLQMAQAEDGAMWESLLRRWVY